MANITVYTFDKYQEAYNKIFAGVYNNFKMKAVQDYNFELEPLEYNEFIESVNAGLINCIILFEQDVPTGFLAYTTVISECLELNIIHVTGDENSKQKRCLLLQKFLEENSELIKQKVVTYSILGKQEELISELPKFNFNTVNQSVMKFDFKNQDGIKLFKEKPLPRLNNGYTTISWNKNYSYEIIKLVYEAFKNTSDAKFDTRFNSVKGTQDIILKITSGVYGEFLKDETKILLYKERPVGVCFANLTNSSIANIPLVAVSDKAQGKKFGVYLLKSVVTDIYQSVLNGSRKLSEINATCDSDNIPAYKMYQSVGFKENYRYKQSYRPIS